MLSVAADLTAELARPHLLGILGDGHSALAALLAHAGSVVSGCDLGGTHSQEKQAALATHLAQLGIGVLVGHDSAHIQRDVTSVVYVNAVRPDDPELTATRAAGLPTLAQHDALGLYASGFERVVAIAGGAGKTSTTAILGTILATADQRPTVYLGARCPNFAGRNYLVGERDLLVIEANEYMNGFLVLPRDIGILGPVLAYDHRDCFGSEESVDQAFEDFVAPLRLLIVDADCPRARKASRRIRRVVSVGRSNHADYRIVEQGLPQGSWTLVDRGTAHEVLTLQTDHRSTAIVENASRAAVTALRLGVPEQAIQAGIQAYRGVARRMEILHAGADMQFLDDYAHNPTQITTLLAALRSAYPHRRIVGVFEPRQHRRLALYLNEFALALADFDRCLLLPVSPGLGDSGWRERVSLAALAEAMRRCGGCAPVLASGYDDGAEKLACLMKNGDVVVTFGTGRPYLVAHRLLQLRNLQPRGH